VTLQAGDSSPSATTRPRSLLEREARAITTLPYNVPIQDLECDAIATGRSDWVWAMIRLHENGAVEVSTKIQTRRAVLLGILGCMAVAGVAGCALGIVLAAWAR
jgi:hypothetical protein